MFAAIELNQVRTCVVDPHVDTAGLLDDKLDAAWRNSVLDVAPRCQLDNLQWPLEVRTDKEECGSMAIMFMPVARHASCCRLRRS